MLRRSDVPLLDPDHEIFDSPPEWLVPGLSRALREEDGGDGSLGLYDLVERAAGRPPSRRAPGHAGGNPQTPRPGPRSRLPRAA